MNLMMIWIENRDLGKVILSLTFILFFYYTLWVIVLPFVDEDYKETINAYFPPVELALVIPSSIGTIIFLSLLLRAYTLIKMDRERERAANIAATTANHS